MQGLMAKLPVIIFLAVVFSVVVMGVSHTDELPTSSNTPILDMVMDKTDRGTNAEAGSDDCVQIVRQIRSLFAAMAAAICTISTVGASTRGLQVFYGSIAGLMALKAVFHQFMHITLGDPTIPLTIIIVAAVLTVAPAIGAFSSSHRSDAQPGDISGVTQLNCGNCRFATQTNGTMMFAKDEVILYECRRNAPLAALGNRTFGWQGRFRAPPAKIANFPVVDARWWCGEHQRMDS